MDKTETGRWKCRVEGRWDSLRSIDGRGLGIGPGKGAGTAAVELD